jgi:hypothetical protein
MKRWGSAHTVAQPRPEETAAREEARRIVEHWNAALTRGDMARSGRRRSCCARGQNAVARRPLSGLPDDPCARYPDDRPSPAGVGRKPRADCGALGAVALRQCCGSPGCLHCRHLRIAGATSMQNQYVRMVGAAGFEPATWSTQNSRATRLRYTPMGSRVWHALPFRYTLRKIAATALPWVPLGPRAIDQPIAHEPPVSAAGWAMPRDRRPGCRTSWRYPR